MKKLISKIQSSLSAKVSIIAVSMFAIVLAINLISKRSTLVEKNKIAAYKEGEKIMRLMNNSISYTEDEALSIASVFSEIKDVKNAYNTYYTTNNFDSASALLESKVLPIIKSMVVKTKEKPKIHFHLPPAKSFCRCWTDKRGDDLTSFRNTILEISNTHKPIKGIEVGRGGFAIRGIAPIFDDSTGKYLGSVEAFFTLDYVLQKIITDHTENYAVYMASDQLNIATQLQGVSGINKSNHSINNYVLINSSNGYVTDKLTPEDFTFDGNKINHKIIGNNVYSILPIRDYSGKIIGASVAQVDISQANQSLIAETRKFTISAIVILILAGFLVSIYMISVVGKPITNLAAKMEKVAEGELVEKEEVKTKDEIGLIYRSFNYFVDRMKKITDFAKRIGRGELDADIEVSKKDVLGHALLEMRENLKKAKEEEEKRKEEERRRNWITQGLAMFSDILNKNKGDDIEELSYLIISNLVKYLGATQGGLFLLNNIEGESKENLTFGLKACYAYDRKKYLQKEIKWGEGLVGTCALEKQTTYLTDIPEDYMTITSGLGDVPPTSLILVPLINNDEVFGVIEIASLKKFEDYQIEFLEKVAESIAATIASVQINYRTKLLLEQSQQQAEELAAQEEEMRQNMEEMQATQESLAAAKREAEKVKEYLDKLTTPVTAIDTEFNIVYANEAATKLANVTMEKALKSKCFHLFKNKDCNTPNCKLAMAMKNERVFYGKTVIEINGKEIIYLGVPMYDENGNIVGAMEQIIDLDDLSNYM